MWIHSCTNQCWSSSNAKLRAINGTLSFAHMENHIKMTSLAIMGGNVTFYTRGVFVRLSKVTLFPLGEKLLYFKMFSIREL